MSSIDKAIGVFDSGLGGISVLKELVIAGGTESGMWILRRSILVRAEKSSQTITVRIMPMKRPCAPSALEGRPAADASRIFEAASVTVAVTALGTMEM